MTEEFKARLAETKAQFVPQAVGYAGDLARRRLYLFCYWLAETQQTWEDPTLDLGEYEQALRRMRFPEPVVRDYVRTVQDRMDDLMYAH
jgi:hypothetical protein